MNDDGRSEGSAESMTWYNPLALDEPPDGANTWGEFTTVVEDDVDITHVLLNNDEPGKISKEQRTGGWDVRQTGRVNPNFAEFAENCGGQGVRVGDPTTMDGALETGIDSNGPALVEILMDSDPI